MPKTSGNLLKGCPRFCHTCFVIWYYFSVQFEQIFDYWLLGMVIGSVVSVFAKERINQIFAGLKDKKLGLFGIAPACLLGIASPLCMYGTIPIAASFSEKGMRDDWKQEIEKDYHRRGGRK
jgi:uncharacterized membrane protein YraQ (UPF0718 family)